MPEIRTTRALYDGHQTLAGVLADGARVATGTGPVGTVRTTRALVTGGAEILVTPVIPPPLVPIGEAIAEPVVVYRQDATPVPMRIDRKTPGGLVRYILHRIKAVLGIPDSYRDPYEDRF